MGIGLVGLSILVGVALLDWGSGGLQTSVTSPAEIAPTPVLTRLPNTDDPARVAGAVPIQEATAEGLPAIPTAPSDAVMIEVQQDADPLVPPSAAVQNTKDP